MGRIDDTAVATARPRAGATRPGSCVDAGLLIAHRLTPTGVLTTAVAGPAPGRRTSHRRARGSQPGRRRSCAGAARPETPRRERWRRLLALGSAPNPPHSEADRLPRSRWRGSSDALLPPREAAALVAVGWSQAASATASASGMNVILRRCRECIVLHTRATCHRDYRRTNSTRRFRARPSSVSFVSFGRDSP